MYALLLGLIVCGCSVTGLLWGGTAAHHWRHGPQSRRVSERSDMSERSDGFDSVLGYTILNMWFLNRIKLPRTICIVWPLMVLKALSVTQTLHATPPPSGTYRLSATIPGVEANMLRATLGVRPVPQAVAGAVRGVMHLTGPLEKPVFSGTAVAVRAPA